MHRQIIFKSKLRDCRGTTCCIQIWAFESNLSKCHEIWNMSTNLEHVNKINPIFEHVNKINPNLEHVNKIFQNFQHVNKINPNLELVNKINFGILLIPSNYHSCSHPNQILISTYQILFINCCINLTKSFNLFEWVWMGQMTFLIVFLTKDVSDSAGKSSLSTTFLGWTTVSTGFFLFFFLLWTMLFLTSSFEQ